MRYTCMHDYIQLQALLNQARAGYGRRAPGFLKLRLCVCVCVCVRPRGYE